MDQKREAHDPQLTVSGAATSFPFMKLPPELRTIIWKKATPRGRRLLGALFCKAAGWFCPQPPTTAHICRESREVALRYGSWSDSSKDCYGWFNPLADVVIWEMGRGTYETRTAISYQARHITLFFERPSLENYCLGPTLRQMAEHLTWWGDLRTIDISLPPRHQCLIGENWPMSAVKDLFGNDKFVTIDLRDEEDTRRVANLLRQFPAGRHHLLSLLDGTRRLQYHDQSHPASWGAVRDLAQYYWPRSVYERDGDHVADAVRVRGWMRRDLEQPWIKRTLASMPELRPVMVLIRNDNPFEGWLRTFKDL